MIVSSARNHGWDARSSHIRYVPGIVRGIGIALNCFLEKGDKVVVHPPVYHPFKLVPKKNGFEVLFNPLIPIERDGILQRYRMDLDGRQADAALHHAFTGKMRSVGPVKRWS